MLSATQSNNKAILIAQCSDVENCPYCGGSMTMDGAIIVCDECSGYAFVDNGEVRFQPAS